MKKQFFLAALMILCIVCTAACADPIITDTEATAWIAENNYLYLQNADEKHETNAAGVAHFELKTLEDLGPAGYDDEGAYFTFRAFDKQDEPASEEQRIWVEPGDKKALVLKLNPSDQGGGDE